MERLSFNTPGWGVVVAIVLGTIVALASVSDTVASIHHLWTQNNETYSHGYILLLFIVYALATDRRWLAVNPSILGVILALGAGVLWLAASAVQVLTIQQAVLPLAIIALFLATVGVRNTLKASVPLLAFYLALPIVDILLVPLQNLTTYMVGLMVRAHGITAYLEGYNIELPYGVLHIAHGCAGLNYLLAGVCIGGFYAYMNLQRTSLQIRALLLMIVFSLIGNWLRVYGLVLIGYYSKMESSLVAEHGFFGWVIFAAFALIFFMYGKHLEKKDAPLERYTPEAPARKLTGKAAVMATITTCAFIALPLLTHWQSAGAANRQGARVMLPDTLSDFSVSSATPDALDIQFKGADDIQVFDGEVNGQPARLIIVTYARQAQGKELIYFANKVVKPLVEQGNVQTTGGAVNVAVGGTTPRQAYWVYSLGGTVTTGDGETKLLQLKQALSPQLASAFILQVDCNKRCALPESDDAENARVQALRDIKVK